MTSTAPAATTPSPTPSPTAPAGAADAADAAPTALPAPITLTALFDTNERAHAAVDALRRDGIALDRLSIVGKDFHSEERPIAVMTRGDRLRLWGTRGAFWGALFGLLVSPAFFLLPVLGHVVVLGPLTTALVGAIEGAVVTGSLSALGAALASLGVPHDAVIRYEKALKADHFLLVVHGEADIERIMTILTDNGAMELARHRPDAP